MAIITFKDLPDTSTPINAANLNNNFAKDILTAIADDGTITTSADTVYTTITLKQYAKVGTKLSVSNGKILIGSGVSYIKVSAHSTMTNTTSAATYTQLVIYKNESAIQRAAIRNTVNWNSSFDLSPILISVAQGDLISLREYNRIAGSTTIANTYMTVEVVA